MQKTEFEIEKKNLNNIKFEIKVNKKNEQDFFTHSEKTTIASKKNEHVKKIH